jgi:hypothetical protein
LVNLLILLACDIKNQLFLTLFIKLSREQKN